MTAVRALRDAADLCEATSGHPVAVLDVGAGFVGGYAAGSPGEGAVAFDRRSDHGIPGSAVLGTEDGLATLLGDPRARAWVSGHGKAHLSVPRGTIHIVADRLDLGSRGGEWDWLWTRAVPAVQPLEDAVRPLEPSARSEVTRLLERHSPRTHGQAFARPGQLWVGVRGPGGALVAVGCSEPSQGGTPSLAGIAVRADRRGEGWGAAVTAHLTRRAVLGSSGACTLGMFADNDVARRLYHRLGFTTGAQWTSRWFA